MGHIYNGGAIEYREAEKCLLPSDIIAIVKLAQRLQKSTKLWTRRQTALTEEWMRMALGHS